MFLKRDCVLPDMVDGYLYNRKPLSLTFVLSKSVSCCGSCCKRARKWWKGREQRGDKQGRKGWIDNCVHNRLVESGRNWALMCFCLLTSLPLRNRVLSIKKKKNWRFLPFILLRSSLPRSTWNTTRVLDNYRATSLLFFVKLNFGWSVGTAIAVLYSIKPLQSNWDWVKNDWSSVTVDPPSTRALEYPKTTWDGSLVYLHCVVWVGFGMGWAGQDGEGWRLHCYVLINHVSILVWSKLCVCMAELG